MPLRVSGTKIVDEDGNVVMLRGVGLGGHMNMENFISGFPGHESQIRATLAGMLGESDAQFFFDKFLEHFFTEKDAEFIASLGMNCVRVPIHYAHFEDNLNPRIVKQSGLDHLDRVLAHCNSAGLWAVIDLHAVPGGQSGGWHADNTTHVAAFWDHADFQNRAIWLWRELTARYRDHPIVIGYNPLNEPAVEDVTKLIRWYDAVHDAIRQIDPHKIIFFDGNTFASDFSQFGDAHKKWTNSVYAFHDYSGFGFPSSLEKYTGTDEQKQHLKNTFDKKRSWIVERRLPDWNGEFGPVYARPDVEGDKHEEIKKSRYHVLRDQLSLYEETKVGWSIWLYKDIGFQGMTYTSRETAYVKLMGDFLAKKQRLAVDEWGVDDSQPEIRGAYGPIEKLIADNIDPKYSKLYPAPHWSVKRRVARLSRAILVAEFLVPEWADLFRGKSREELEELARSFSLENCVMREELNAILRTASAGRS